MPSAGAKTAPPATVAPPGPASGLAPSVGLPLRFVATGFAAWLAGVVLLVARPDVLATYHYNQYVVAATHLWVLGFLCSVVMGAMYQLVPVALEVRLHSERLARWQFVFHLVGWVGMVAMFWRWDLKQVGHFGSAFAVGVGLFVYNLGRTLRRVPRWNVVAAGVASALAWLSLTVVVGLVVVTGKCTYDSVERLTAANPLRGMLQALAAVAAWVNQFDPLGVMHAHAHLGVVGFFVMMIVAVSYKLLPMFLLSEVQSERRATWSVRLLNGGLAGLFVALAWRRTWQPVAALVLIAGLVLYFAELVAILRARRRRVIDWGLRHHVTAQGLLGLVAVLGLVLGWPGLRVTMFTAQLETVYGWLGIAGVVSFTVLGFLYKIVPFLVWYHSYSRAVGRARVPALADLYSERLQVAGYWSYLAGLLVAAAGAAAGHALLARAGAVILLLSLAGLGCNLGRMLAHGVRPRVVPFGARPVVNPVNA